MAAMAISIMPAGNAVVGQTMLFFTLSSPQVVQMAARQSSGSSESRPWPFGGFGSIFVLSSEHSTRWSDLLASHRNIGLFAVAGSVRFG